MAVFDNSYSRFVAGAKIVLPLIALALLSTLFLVSRPLDPTLRIPIARDELAELARQEQIGKPTFSAMTEDRAAVTIVARSAVPKGAIDDGLVITDAVAVIEPATGGSVRITAPRMETESSGRTADLSGGVVVTTSDGYVIRSEAMSADLKKRQLVATTTVEATGPGGTFRAGGMDLSLPQGGDFVLVFTGGIELVYDPPKETGQEQQ